jgi:DNA primase
MRGTPGRPARIVVVEGFADVIALAQHGLGPAIATMGTAATAENMRQVTRLSDRIVFCFDGDRAGRDAAWRALQSVLPFGGGKVAVEFVLLPEGEDPDSFVRAKGKDAFEALLAAATPLSTFMIEQAAAGLDLGNADARARLTGVVLPLLERLPRGLYRELIAGELAEKTGIASATLLGLLEHDEGAGTTHRARGQTEAARTVMQKAIGLLLHFPQAAAAAADVPGLDEIDAPGAELLRRLLEIAAKDPQITTGQLVETFRGEREGRWIERLAAQEPLDDESAAPRVLRDSLERIVESCRRKAEAEAIRRHGSPASPV